MGWIVMVALTLLAGARPVSASSAATRARSSSPPPPCCSRSPAMPGRAIPASPARPRRRPERQQLPDSDFARTREDLLGRFDHASAWLTIADGFQRRGDTRSAAELLAERGPPQPGQCRPLGRLRQCAGRAWRRHDEPGRPARLPARRRARARPSRRRASSTASRSPRAAITTRPSGSGASSSPIAPPDAPYRRIVEERLQALEQARARPGAPNSPPPSEAGAGDRRRAGLSSPAPSPPSTGGGSARPPRTAGRAPRPPPGGGSCRPRR